MKKLPFDSSDWKKIGTINDLIDLVNSQQEAIEKLERRTKWLELHATGKIDLSADEPVFKPADNQAKKALDEVQPNE